MGKLKIRIPDYTLGEEIVNSISHGAGAVFGIVALVLMIIKAHGAMTITCVSIFGASIIILYTISCIYHSLSPRLTGKQVLRVIDHCNVFLLVFGTYIPASLIGVRGKLGWFLFGFVALISLIGIVASAVDVDRNGKLEVICHLICGWSIVVGLPSLKENIPMLGIEYMIIGGLMYTIGSILYGLGKKIRYMHSVFHFFCLFGTLFHFWAIFAYII